MRISRCCSRLTLILSKSLDPLASESYIDPTLIPIDSKDLSVLWYRFAVGLDGFVGKALDVLVLVEVSSLQVDGSSHQRLPQRFQDEVDALVIVDGVQRAVFQLFFGFPLQGTHIASSQPRAEANRMLFGLSILAACVPTFGKL